MLIETSKNCFQEIIPATTKYLDVKLNSFATGDIASGYNGERLGCLFSLVGTKIVAVHDFGYHSIGESALSKKEAHYRLLQSPLVKKVESVCDCNWGNDLGPWHNETCLKYTPF